MACPIIRRATPQLILVHSGAEGGWTEYYAGFSGDDNRAIPDADDEVVTQPIDPVVPFMEVVPLSTSGEI